MTSRQPVATPAASAAPGLSRQRRIVVLLVWLAIVAAGVVLITRTHFSADLSAFLPRSPDARQRVLIEQLQTGVASRTLLVGIEDGTDAAQRAVVSRSVASAMRESGLFDQVQNGDASDWKAAGTWLFDHRYRLSTSVTPERFTAAGLHDAIADTLSLLGTPAGNLVKPLLERDPTGETQGVAESLIPRQRTAHRSRRVDLPLGAACSVARDHACARQRPRRADHRHRPGAVGFRCCHA